jgi:hypothetical protein
VLKMKWNMEVNILKNMLKIKKNGAYFTL